MSAPVDVNPFGNEPKADKVWDVTLIIHPHTTKRVEANTAFYAARKAFPSVAYADVTCTCIGPAVVKVQTDSLYGVMGSTHPLGDDESCPYCNAYVPEGSQRDLLFRLSAERQRNLAIRVASRLRRETAMHAFGIERFGFMSRLVACELLDCSDALAGDQCE